MNREDGLKRLSGCREEIDELDVRIVELLNRRTEVVERIGTLKEELALPIYEPKREDQVFENVTGSNRGPLPADALKRIFERIIDEMRNVQRLRMLERKERIQESRSSGAQESGE